MIVEDKFCDTQYDLNNCKTGCQDNMIVEFMTYLKHHGFIPTPSFKGNSDKKTKSTQYSDYTFPLFCKAWPNAHTNEFTGFYIIFR
jgi:hypothetical protein